MKRSGACAFLLFSLVVSAGAAELGELSDALDTESLVWTTGAGAAWFRQTGVTFDGEDAAQSGAIGPGQQVWLETVVTGPGMLFFCWKVSSESGYDYLRFYVDGSEKAEGLSGEVEWAQEAVSIGPGAHVLRWEYSKDGSADDGSDCGWVDYVDWYTGVPYITVEPEDAVVPSGTNALLKALAVGDAPLWYQWYEGESGDTSVPLAGATNNTYTTLPMTADASFWVLAGNELGEVVSRTARVRVGLEVHTLEDLQMIGSDTGPWAGWTLDAAYILMSNIDASATAVWNDAGTDESVLEGFAPIGRSYREWFGPGGCEFFYEEAIPFTGTFDGGGHVISRLAVNRGGQYGVGLFGCLAAGAVVQNVGLIGVQVAGDNYVGGLVGESAGRVVNCFTAGEVSGRSYVGGVVGMAGSLWGGGAESAVLLCYSLANVGGEDHAGGLAGYNGGSISECYAIPQANGSDDLGGLVGYTAYWDGATVDRSYWDIVSSGAESSAGGEGKTSDQMRQGTTFSAWSFGSVWGIQEGSGAPYLLQFAAGMTSHAAEPSAVHPANLATVWALRPVMTAEVAWAACDFVGARWQIATSADFSDARDWMGVNPDGDALRSPFSSRVPLAYVLQYGAQYYWRVRVQTGYGMWSGWSSPAMFLVSKPEDALTAGRDEIGIWGQALVSSQWRTNDLFCAHDDFSAAVEASGTNYEARIFRAITTLATLSEEPELRVLLADFGYTFDEGLFAITGQFARSGSPLPNSTVDRLAAEALPALDLAAADLAVIPTNWTGSVALTPDDSPVDETVHVDVGDILYARAVLGGARAALETAQAYDLSADYSKTNIYLAQPVAQALEVTLDGDESEWTNTTAVLFGEKAQVEYAKIARSATQIHVLMRLAEGVEVQSFWFELGAATNRYRFLYNGFPAGVLVSDDPCAFINLDNVIEITYTIPAEEQGEAFHLSGVGAEYPNALPGAAPEVAVTEDGVDSEWSAVPVSLAGKGHLIGSAKIARSGAQAHVLVTLRDGWTFDNLTYVGIDVATFSGNSFWGDLWSEGVTYVSQGGVLEVSVPIPVWCQGDSLLLDGVNIELAVDACNYEFDGVSYVWSRWDEGSGEEKRQSVNQFLADHPACLSTVRNPGKLPSAKAALREALALAVAADAAVTGRTDGVMHFFEYDPAHSNEQAEARQRLHEALASMDAPQPVAGGGQAADVFLGAFFDAPVRPRALTPRLTDDNEVVVGTFPDPTLSGLLPDMTQAGWQDELLGCVPLVRERAFTWDGQTFTTGGYAFWDVAAAAGGETDVAVSGAISNACVTWVETALTGPGTLTFSWAASTQEKVDVLSVYVDGVRQVGSLSGLCDWGPRQLVLTGGVHRVRWAYVRNEGGGLGGDGGMIDNLAWASSAPNSTDTPVRVPYAWLDGFAGLVEGGDYEAAAWSDQDGDGKKTWEEYVAGTAPTNTASVFLATIHKEGPSLEVGWTPDLGALRLYTVEGKAVLADAEWSPTNAASRFFRVRVQMP